ncbi:DNA-binding MarR family transcriptional regulator/N-acetylglutamate synthase-like GNAT family acetyltransferase [Amycolatopsis lexingtonensis]|uniref:DNA-binding MarR family transcriptional regulator/N-acetylglutamate synthase-like GNAT family acetyltransferase n=1 Tax=Amycolatopsis lexingtonensis TaxID=218822 RepID=A0ABR9I9E2_9PSEU|nr:helix-turn-helix domain-containing GNAT family N-acetyltransferase [Amycolatopsis lexingtonensis]MBE1499800.1 DNA-binding MarR family transcriptional regulator/N-acetylglutamate synthase-like GNAT family acetyltransferase [Amycolatopsis lexingtonensis]
MNDDRVAAVRAFNRLYTGVIGVLDEGPADAEYSLPEARVLFELAHQDPMPVTDLRKRLDLDAGYASRLLARLESRGLIARERSAEDARRQLVRPTAAGRDAYAVLNRRSTEQIGGLLRRFADEDQERLLAAMRTIGDLVGDRRRDPVLVLRPPRPGDLGWVVERHGALYGREYGFDDRFEGLVARIVADFVDNRDDPRQAYWIAELDGQRVGGIACTRGADADTAKLRLLLLEPSARGHGVGKRLVTECVEFARSHGYRAMELSTVSILTAARSIYRAAGFELVAEADFDDWGPKLTDETWRLKF